MPYSQYNRAQLRGLVQNQLGPAASVFWRDDELNQYIQLGLRFLNMLMGYWKTRTTITTGVDTVWYAMPGAVTSSMRVTFQGVPLSPVSSFDMDYARTNWEGETTASGGDVPTQPQFFIVTGFNLVGIWPADHAGNSAMTVDGIASTPILSNDGSVVDMGQEELTGFLDLMQAVAVFKEGGKEFTDSTQQFQTFLKAAAERNGMLKRSATYRRWMGLDRGRAQKPFRETADVEKAGAR